jgi:hypothetical protein
VLTVIVVGSMVLAGRAAGGSEPLPHAAGGRYVVRSGDTLWGIARSLAGPEQDPRPVIEAIRDVNRLGTAALEVGRALVLP